MTPSLMEQEEGGEAATATAVGPLFLSPCPLYPPQTCMAAWWLRLGVSPRARASLPQRLLSFDILWLRAVAWTLSSPWDAAP